jgi:osmotically-inducible protein OsmY
MIAELRGTLRSGREEVTDEVLGNRVRSQIGRHVSHPRAIEVAAHDGVVTLRGPILANEVDELLTAVLTVRGVRDVDDQLDVHKTAKGISALQGGMAT